MTEQKPSLGRIVLFRENDDAVETPAIIVKVWSDTCVNLCVFVDADERTARRITSVVFEAKGGWSWRWPPRV
jgi:hypothetical protein